MLKILCIVVGLVLIAIPCLAQQSEQICVQIFDTSSGVTVIKCNPVSITNPFPTTSQ